MHHHNLICPGYAKCGTTLLHFLFQNSNRFVGPTNKEYSFFRQDQDDYNAYTEIFDTQTDDEDIVHFEFSPTYFSELTKDAVNRIANRIKDNLPESKILFAIRNPLNRSFSHYIHQLQSYSRFGSGNHTHARRNFLLPYQLSFEQAVATDPKIHGHYTEYISTFIDVFGAENCIFFFLESDIANYQDFKTDLLSKFDLSNDNERWNKENIPHILKGTLMPQYFYGSRDGVLIKTEKGDIKLPPKTLYIANNIHHELVHNVNYITGTSLMNSQRFWTNEIDSSDIERIYDDYFADSIMKFKKILAKTNYLDKCPDYSKKSCKPKKIESVQPNADFLIKNLPQ